MKRKTKATIKRSVKRVTLSAGITLVIGLTVIGVFTFIGGIFSDEGPLHNVPVKVTVIHNQLGGMVSNITEQPFYELLENDFLIGLGIPYCHVEILMIDGYAVLTLYEHDGNEEILASNEIQTSFLPISAGTDNCQVLMQDSRKVLD